MQRIKSLIGGPIPISLLEQRSLNTSPSLRILNSVQPDPTKSSLQADQRSYIGNSISYYLCNLNGIFSKIKNEFSLLRIKQFTTRIKMKDLIVTASNLIANESNNVIVNQKHAQSNDR